MGRTQETRLAIIGIVVSDLNSVEQVNAILHAYAHVIIGRMGIPYHKRKVSIISVAVDGTVDEINSLTGKLGALSGVSSKAMWR